MEIRGPSQLPKLDPLRLLEGQTALFQALARSGGGELEALIAARLPEGLLLELLTGQVIQAAGELPFPEGTKLRLRVVPDPASGTLRLEPREATPPPPRPLLAPLEQGEAAPLLQRLQRPGPLPAPLEAVKEALAEAGGWIAGETMGAPEAPGSGLSSHPLWGQAPGIPSSIPPAPQLAATLVTLGLPAKEAEAWSRFLLGETPQPPDAPQGDAPAAQMLRRALATPLRPPPQAVFAPEQAPLPAASPEKESIAEKSPPSFAPSASSAVEQELPVRAEDGLAELRRAQVPEALLPQMLPLLLLSRLPQPADSALEQLFRALLPQIPLAQAKAEPGSPKTKPGTPDTRTGPSADAQATRGESEPVKPQGSRTRPETRPAPEARIPAPEARSPKSEALPLHAPEPWESLLQSATRALSHPEASPREAPFHALQGREGTALFELPLPFPGFQGPLELWVEKDGEGPDSEGEVRLLLALDMEGTGPLRLGFSALAGAVRAQVWTEEARAPHLAMALQAELGDPPPFPVQVKAFHGPQPTLRRVAGSEGFGAMG